MFFKHCVRVILLGLAVIVLNQPTTATQMIEIIPPPPVPGESVQTLYTESRPAIEPVSIFDAPEEKNLGVDVRLWHSDLAGQIDSRGMNLGLSADTSISAQSSGNLSGSWQFADNTQLQLDYFKFDHSGHTNRNVTFDNRNYAAGSTIRLRNNIFGLGLSHILSENDEGSFKLLYGFRFSQLNTKIEQSFAAGIRAGELDQNIGMPYLGVEGTARLSDNAGLTGSARFFDFDKNGEANRLSDFDLAFEFGRDYQNMPASQEWYGVLGYRYFMLHDESDGNSSRVVYSGPVLGLRGKF